MAKIVKILLFLKKMNLQNQKGKMFLLYLSTPERLHFIGMHLKDSTKMSLKD